MTLRYYLKPSSRCIDKVIYSGIIGYDQSSVSASTAWKDRSFFSSSLRRA